MADKTGTTKTVNGQKKKWNGRRWVPVGPAPRTTRTGTSGTGRSRASRSTTNTTTTTTIPASKRPADMRQGQVYGTDSKSTGRNWSKPYGQKSDKPSSGDPNTWKKTAPKPTPPKPTPPKTTPPKTTPPKTTPPKTTPKAASASDAQNLTQGRSPDKPASKPRTWLADNYKPGGPPKKSESLQIKPKKKKLTNKQRKQGGFH